MQHLIRRLSAVGGDQLGVGGGFLVGFDDRSRPPAEKFGPVGATRRSDPVEFGDEFVIELDEHFTSGHGHMLYHMILLHTRLNSRAERGKRRVSVKVNCRGSFQGCPRCGGSLLGRESVRAGGGILDVRAAE